MFRWRIGLIALSVLCGCHGSSQAPRSADSVARQDGEAIGVSDSATRASDTRLSSLLFDSVSAFVGNPYIAVSIGEWQRQRAVKIVVQDSLLARADDSTRQRMALAVARYARKFVVRDPTVQLIVSGVTIGGIGDRRTAFLYSFPIGELSGSAGTPGH